MGNPSSMSWGQLGIIWIHPSPKAPINNWLIRPGKLVHFPCPCVWFREFLPLCSPLPLFPSPLRHPTSAGGPSHAGFPGSGKYRSLACGGFPFSFLRASQSLPPFPCLSLFPLQALCSHIINLHKNSREARPAACSALPLCSASSGQPAPCPVPLGRACGLLPLAWA